MLSVLQTTENKFYIILSYLIFVSIQTTENKFYIILSYLIFVSKEAPVFPFEDSANCSHKQSQMGIGIKDGQ